MKRKINIRISIILVVAVVTMALSVRLIHRLQARRGAGALLGQAVDAQKRGQSTEAVGLLRRYLDFAPDDNDALTRLGLILASGASIETPDGRSQAIEILERALRKDPSKLDARRKVADLLIKDGRFDEATSHLTALLASRPNDGVLEEELGRCQEATGSFVGAAASYEKSRTHNPTLIDSHVRLALLYRRKLDRAAEADRVMDAREVKDGLLARNPKSFRALLARSAYRDAFKLPGAEADVSKALELSPGESDVLLAAANSAGRNGKAEEARTHLTRGIGLHPKEERFYDALAGLESRTGRAAVAIDVLKQGTSALPDNVKLQWSLGMLLAESNRGDESAELIAQLRKAGIRPEPLDYLEARNLVGRGQWTAARKILTRIAPILSSRTENAELTKRAYILLGQCEGRLGNPDQQYLAYRRAVAENSPDGGLDAEAHYGLGSALSALGKPDEAISEFENSLARLGASPRARVDLARLYVLQAMEKPQTPETWKEVEKKLEDIEKSVPSTFVEIEVLRADSLAFRGNLDEADSCLKKAIERAPDRVEPRAVLSAIADRKGRPVEALAILDEAERRLGDIAELRLARARHWSEINGEEAMKALDRLGEGLEKFGADDSRKIRGVLIESFARAGAKDRAARLRDQMIAEQPDDLQLRLAQYDEAAESGDESRVTEILGRIRGIEGDEGTLWRYGRAMQVIRQAKRDPNTPTDEARSLLQEVATRRPSWSRVARSEGELAEVRGDEGSALGGYLRAVELGDRSPETIRRAVRLLYRRGRYVQADRLLRQLEERGPVAGDLQRVATEISLKNRDFRRALALSQKAVQERPKDHIDWIWLGQASAAVAVQEENQGRVEEAAKSRSEAEKAMATAVDLAPANPAPRLALVQYFAATGRKARAIEEIDRTKSLLKGEKSALILAQCYEAAGEAGKAAEFYKQALSEKKEDPETIGAFAAFSLKQGHPREAEEQLRKYIETRSQSPKDSTWARNLLALVLTSEQDPGRSRMALDLLDLKGVNTPDGSTQGNGSENVKVQARVLAAQGDRAHRRQAIEMLKTLAARDELRGNDLLLLAQLLELDGDWAASRRAMQKLLADDSKNPSYLAAYARSLLARRLADEAEPWIAELEKLRPNDPQSIELRARALSSRGKSSEAVPAIEALARNGDPARIASCANLLESIGQKSAAETMFRRLDGLPIGNVEMTRFLGRQGRLAEALEWAERAWRDGVTPAETISNVCVIALYGGHPQETLIRKVAERIDLAIKANPSSLSLQFDKANLLLLAERYDEAETIFRKSYDADRRNIGPLNNIAWLRALRGAPDAGLSLVEQAISMAGATPDLLDTRGLVHLTAGRTQDAIADLEESAPSDMTGVVKYHLAVAYARSGRRADAERCLSEARGMNFSLSDIHPLERRSFSDVDEKSLARP